MPETEKGLKAHDDTEPPTTCDRCPDHFSFLIVAWGRELTPEEKRLNQILIDEGKAEKCQAYERYFNKSFPKKKGRCAEMESDPDYCEDWEE